MANQRAEGGPLWNYLNWHRPEVDVQSPASFDSAKRWLSECDDLHKRTTGCRPLRTRLPNRILDVSGITGSDIRLYSDNGRTANESTQYACLTYCWGKTRNFVTNLANVSGYHESIPVNLLPKTLQDAVTVTRRLNIQYFWIDSLCIVQDDDAEREEQLNLMGEIFENAYVTISAACAADVGEGFLHCRNPLSRTHTTPYRGSITPHEAKDYWIREPKHSRAWTLQEALLSPRVLHYGDMELSWICSDGYRQVSSIIDHLPNGMVFKLLSLREIFSERPTSHLDEKRTQWENIMVEFSHRALSRESDKLPALAGLAERVSYLLPGDCTYLAGIWSAWLIPHLAWRVTENAIGRRPQDWRGPSWSWLSIDGALYPNAGSSLAWKLGGSRACMVGYCTMWSRRRQASPLASSSGR